MTVTETLMKPGRFDLKLVPGAPFKVWSAVREFDHIVITPVRMDPVSIADANLLSAAIYTGVVTGKPSPRAVTGQGLAYWLGTDQGVSDVLDTAVTQSSANLATWIGALRPSSIAAGTVTSPAGSLSATFQWMSRREAIDAVCRHFGAEWRINPNATLDAAVPATLFTNYTTPDAVITRRGEGREGGYYGLQATDLGRSTDVEGYTTKVIVVGKRGDGAEVVTGSATGANVYKDFHNNNVVMERLINAPSTTAAGAATQATALLALYSSLRQAVTVSSDQYAVAFRVRPGDQVYVYDPAAGLVDTANQVPWRGETIFPVKVRCRSYTWPIQRGMGVYARRSGATPTYTDLTDFVDWETGPTRWEVGSSVYDPEQDSNQLGGGAYLGSHPDIVARVGDPSWTDYTPTLGNITGGVINNAEYRYTSANSIDINVQVDGTATAAGTVTFTLPVTCTTFVPLQCLISTGGLVAVVSSARAVAGGTTVTVYGSSAGANFGAGAVCNFGVQGSIRF